jgi:hypothetical protein
VEVSRWQNILTRRRERDTIFPNRAKVGVGLVCNLLPPCQPPSGIPHKLLEFPSISFQDGKAAFDINLKLGLRELEVE